MSLEAGQSSQYTLSCTIEQSELSAEGIASITISGNTVTVTYEDKKTNDNSEPIPSTVTLTSGGKTVATVSIPANELSGSTTVDLSGGNVVINVFSIS